MRNFLVAVAVGSFFLASSCQKNSTDKEPTKTELITKTSWKFSKAEANGMDANSYIDDCFKDNTAIFASDGSGTLDEGATKCDSSDPQSSPFSWEFLNNETTLSVSGGLFAGQSGDFTIVSLTDSTMVLSGTMPITSNGITINVAVTVTFIH